jgi:hypothetical protein
MANQVNVVMGEGTGSSDEEMKEEYDVEQQNESGASGNEHYWREKEKTSVSTRIYAHKCIIAQKSPYFASFFKDEGVKKQIIEDKLVVDFAG